VFLHIFSDIWLSLSISLLLSLSLFLSFSPSLVEVHTAGITWVFLGYSLGIPQLLLRYSPDIPYIFHGTLKYSVAIP